MEVLLCCQTYRRSAAIGWLSFQKDGSISFGLNDETFTSPKFLEHYSIWSAYNRVAVRYTVPSNDEALVRIKQPHFTFHPPSQFHLKTRDMPQADALFFGIADPKFVVWQQSEMPWIRAVSAQVGYLKSPSFRHGGAQPVVLSIGPVSEYQSVAIAVDFIDPNQITVQVGPSVGCFAWHDVAIRIALSISPPSRSILSWFHSF